MSGEYVRVTVTVDTDELREWAGKHADAGHHGVAEVLYRAANEAESITEEHDTRVASESAERALRDAADAIEGGLLDPTVAIEVGLATREDGKRDTILTLRYRADRIASERTTP